MIASRPALAAAQRRSRAFVEDWRDGAAQRQLADTFAACADAAAVARAAAPLLADADWVAALLDPMMTALADDPWFEPPLRVARDPLRTSAILYSDDKVLVAATVLSAVAMAPQPPPATIAFTGRVALVRYHRAGGARLLRWAAPRLKGDVDLATAPTATPLPPRDLADGDVVRLDGREEAHAIVGATSDVVTVSVAAKLGADACGREHAVAGGALLRAAMLDETPARTQMLLTLLRLSGRRDAAACFEAATRDGAFHLRWAAMREWLAVDTAGALPRLAAMADDANAEVRAAARTTLALIERRAQCPA